MSILPLCFHLDFVLSFSFSVYHQLCLSLFLCVSLALFLTLFITSFISPSVCFTNFNSVALLIHHYLSRAFCVYRQLCFSLICVYISLFFLDLNFRGSQGQLEILVFLDLMVSRQVFEIYSGRILLHNQLKTAVLQNCIMKSSIYQRIE